MEARAKTHVINIRPSVVVWLVVAAAILLGSREGSLQPRCKGG